MLDRFIPFLGKQNWNRLLSRTLLRSRLKISKQNKFVLGNSLLYKSRIQVGDSCNSIIIGNRVKLLHTSVRLNGSGNILIIEDNVNLTGVEIRVWGDDNTLRIGSSTTMNKGTTISVCDGTTLEIGQDCMVSFDVVLRTSDGHSIVKDGGRINPGKDVQIGDHVWIGLRSVILKGSGIPSGSIIGANSLVTGRLARENSIYFGQPVKCGETEISWER